MKPATDSNPTVAWQPLSQHMPLETLSADEQMSHPLDKRRVKYIREHFNAASLGVLVVSKRADGRNIVIDGQKRLVVLAERMATHAPCLVYTGLSPSDEARLYLDYNVERNSPDPVTRYRYRRQTGEGKIALIDTVLNECGLYVIEKIWRTHPQEQRGIYAVKSIEALYDQGGTDLLRRVLTVNLHLWPTDVKAIEHTALLGMGRFIRTYREHVLYSTDEVYRKLQTTPVVTLLKQANETYHLSSDAKVLAFAKAVLKGYNLGKSTSALPIDLLK